MLDDDELNIDWGNLESIIIPDTAPHAALPDEESADSATLMQHPFFSRLTTALTACQEIGRSTAKVSSDEIKELPCYGYEFIGAVPVSGKCRERCCSHPSIMAATHVWQAVWNNIEWLHGEQFLYKFFPWHNVRMKQLSKSSMRTGNILPLVRRGVHQPSKLRYAAAADP